MSSFNSGCHDGGKAVVRFELGMWYLNEDINNCLYDICEECYVEVLGNIYENPELLKD